jgi:serine/threonine protein kinase
VVYLATDERLLGVPVVIKFLLDSAQSAWITKKFLQEAEALTRIKHPGVVKVLDRDRTDDGRPFMVMEFVKGRALRTAMASEGLDLEYAAVIVREIGQALGASHREGVLHRDLKPENIMLETLSDGDEHVKLIDFGIAKIRESLVGTSTELDVVAGTLQYMSPEQLNGQPVSVASDVYAFATIAYELVTGLRPFRVDARNQVAAIQQLMTLQREGPVVMPQQLRPTLSADAQALMLRALAFDPARRPADARQFGEELAAALAAGDRVSQSTAQERITTVNVPPARSQAMAAPSSPTLGPDAAPRAAPEKRRPIAILAGGALAAVAVAAILAALSDGRTAEPGASAPASSISAAPGPRLSYAVWARRNPKLFPDSRSEQVADERIFSAGDLVRFSFSSSDPGFLYVFNESPATEGKTTAFNVLFPSPTSNDGSARLMPDRGVSIPEKGDGFELDAEAGAEKLWLVWSSREIEALGKLARWANPKDKGEINDAAEADALRGFLAEHATPAPDVRRDERTAGTIITGRGDMFVKLVTLEHRQ